MTTAAQNTESAPADFGEYLALKSQTKTESSAPSVTAQPPAEEEPAPASEPEIVQEPKTGLTDEEKAERKARNDKRREERWWEERGRLRAEKERLERELEEARAAKQTESAPVLPVQGKPTLKQFLDSGKFETYEEANEAYLDARDQYNRQLWESEQSQTKAEQEAQTVRKTFQAEVEQFSKTHDDWGDVFEAVKDALDGEEASGTPLTAAILKSKNSAALIYHLGKNEEALSELQSLSDSGDFPAALVLLGEIKASLSSTKAKAPEPEKKNIDTPKPPKHVSGRGAASSRDDQLREAAEKNDFTAFQRVNRSRA